jgi:hypothetical protein
MCLAAAMAWHASLFDLFCGFLPVLVFVFYAVIAIWPCRALTALVVGVVLHIPLLFVIARLFRGRHEDRVYAAVFVFAAVVWAAYVIQLRRHENAA